MDLRWIQNPKVKGKQTMNKLIRSAMMMASVGAMLCIVGCGEKEETPDAVALEQAQSVLKDIDPDGSMTCKVSKSEVNGDKAVVSVDILANGKVETTEKIELINVGGKWIDPKNTAEYAAVEYMKKCAEMWKKSDPGEYVFKTFKEDVDKAEENGWGEIRVQVLKDGKKYNERRASVTRTAGGVWKSNW